MQGGLVTRKLFVRRSVSLSNACIVTKRKKHVPTFLQDMKDHLHYFYDRKKWLKFWVKLAPLERKQTPIFNRYFLVAPQP